MKNFYLTILLIFSWLTAMPQISTIPAYGTDSTLDIATWNVENFPKNKQATISYLWQIIQKLDLDVIAFQEMYDTVGLRQVVSQLPDYKFYCKSNYYGGLAFIYKKDVIHINNIYEIYTTSPYWSPFPRAPLVMDMNFAGQQFFIIDNHLKCCGDGYLQLNDQEDEETRRYRAANYLGEYIDALLEDKKVMVVGDMNDELTDQTSNNVFINLINSSDKYRFADMDIAEGNSEDWSYPAWPSHLDHMLITNELYDDIERQGSEIRAIKIDEYLTNGWYEYDKNVSDHRPVAVKLNFSGAMAIEDIAANSDFSCYPNPATDKINFHFRNPSDNARIEIADITGKTLAILQVPGDQNDVLFNLDGLSKGIFFAKYIIANRIVTTKKIIVY